MVAGTPVGPVVASCEICHVRGQRIKTPLCDGKVEIIKLSNLSIMAKGISHGIKLSVDERCQVVRVLRDLAVLQFGSLFTIDMWTIRAVRHFSMVAQMLKAYTREELGEPIEEHTMSRCRCCGQVFKLTKRQVAVSEGRVTVVCPAGCRQELNVEPAYGLITAAAAAE